MCLYFFFQFLVVLEYFLHIIHLRCWFRLFSSKGKWHERPICWAVCMIKITWIIFFVNTMQKGTWKRAERSWSFSLQLAFLVVVEQFLEFFLDGVEHNEYLIIDYMMRCDYPTSDAKSFIMSSLPQCWFELVHFGPNLKAHERVDHNFFSEEDQTAKLTAFVSQLKRSFFEDYRSMVPWNTQIIDSYFHVWVSSDLDFLSIWSDHCKNFAIAVLVEPLKDNKWCSRPLKVDECVFLIIHFDFVWQVLFAELTLQFWKSIDWNQSILLPSYFTLYPCL